MAGKWRRFLLGVILPPIIAAFMFTFHEKFLNTGLQAKGNFFQVFLISSAFAFILCGVQCTLYSYLMEFQINRKIKDHSIAVLISAGLGLVCGFPVGILVVIGPLTGLLTGGILRAMYIREKKANGSEP